MSDMLAGGYAHEIVVDGGVTVEPLPDEDGEIVRGRLHLSGLLTVDKGSFVSMVDPPSWAVEAVSGCSNAGTWPVLAGDSGGDDVMLCAPIILYDHPETAPESPGDLYDATEIDEILTLRTLALTDEEKREARATDPRAAAVIDRSESWMPMRSQGCKAPCVR